MAASTTLQEEILAKSSEIKTDSYPMSIGELINMYKENELDVHPEFQRVYRWSDSQKTKLIESILLGIPIPPVFVSQRKDGVWDVVDGQQRLSTIMQFIGCLRDESNELRPPLVLQKTEFLPSLEGKTWQGDNSFSRDLQLFVKRAKIDVNIVLKESDDEAKYELFMRLNTGGTPLEPQEVRNCLMIMAYPAAYSWLETLAHEQAFTDAIALSDKKTEEQYAMELATRFVLFRTMDEKDLKDVGDIGEFLNKNVESIHSMSEKKKAMERNVFLDTFTYIVSSMEDQAFRRYDHSKQGFRGGFSISAFEAVAIGLGFNHNNFPSPNDFRGLVQAIWEDQEFVQNSGSGIRASTRIPKIVPLGRSRFHA